MSARGEGNETAEHLARFQAHYDRLRDVNQSDEWKVATAERFASNPGMGFLIEDTLSSVAPYPFFHDDYADIQPPVKGKR